MSEVYLSSLAVAVYDFYTYNPKFLRSITRSFIDFTNNCFSRILSYVTYHTYVTFLWTKEVELAHALDAVLNSLSKIYVSRANNCTSVTYCWSWKRVEFKVTNFIIIIIIRLEVNFLEYTLYVREESVDSSVRLG